MRSLQHSDSCESAFLCRLAKQQGSEGEAAPSFSHQPINFRLCLPRRRCCLHVFAEHPKFQAASFPARHKTALMWNSSDSLCANRWRRIAFSDSQLPAELHSITRWCFWDLAQDSRDLYVPLSSFEFFFSSRGRQVLQHSTRWLMP